jgi:hypothetical protein
VAEAEHLERDRLRRGSRPWQSCPDYLHLWVLPSALANVPRGLPSELEGRRSGRHHWVLRGKLAQSLLVLGLDHR